MVISSDGEICGTIGGGIMEHKLVEKAKALLLQDKNRVFLMRQHHDKEHANDQSGMICSGSQLIAFTPLSLIHKEIIKKIIAAKMNTIKLSPEGIELVQQTAEGLQYETDMDWAYTETLNQQPIIHIIGGGHIGLALSELMHYLGFYIKLYDNRPELNTIELNSFAHEKHFINYETVNEQFNNCENDFVVIMTVGYRTDKIVVKQLIRKPFFYIGLLGSNNKIKILLNELGQEGFSGEAIKNLHL